MQILYTNFHKSPGIGGHSIYILSLICALADHHDITVAVPQTSGLYRRARDIGNVYVAAQEYPNRPAAQWRAARHLRALMIERHIQIVHVNGSADHRLVMLARMGMGSRKPAVVFTKHNDQPISPLSAFVRATLGTNHVIAVCDFVRRRVDATPYRRTGVTTIANGIDTAYYDRSHITADHTDQAQVDEYRRAWTSAYCASTTTDTLVADDASAVMPEVSAVPEISVVPTTLAVPAISAIPVTPVPPDAPRSITVFGSQAGTDDYKGWMDLVHAVASLPEEFRRNVRIALAGAWPKDTQVEEVRAAGMKDQVFFAGPLNDVRPFLAALDVGFVLSWRVETISFACREMMSMGLPVIVSDHGGLPENINSGVDGWIVPRRDISAIAKRVEKIMIDPASVRQVGQAARARAVAHFGIECFVGSTEAVYQRLLLAQSDRA